MLGYRIKITSFLAALASVNALAAPAPAKKVNLDERILFGWCRESSVTQTCGKRRLDHGACYDFDVLDRYLNDNIETVTAKGGRCVIWEKNGCSGDHTGMIVGSDIAMNTICPRYPWSSKASSVKCCGGDSNAMWCADPGFRPKCTD